MRLSLRRLFCRSLYWEAKMFDYVVVGGTFDRIHDGHRLLLNKCLQNSRKGLTVGVTDAAMVRKKLLPELILPCERRIQDVKDYLEKQNPNLEYNIVPISDPFGPSIEDHNLEAIVGSKETEKGCLAVNEIRQRRNMPTLEVIIIDLVVDSSHGEFEEGKVSSSSQRMRLLGTELRKPLKEWHPKQGPYLIGLTGGSASGKTQIGKKLEKMGAGIINCDLMGHKAYEPGTKCYQEVVKAFDDNGDLVGNDGQIVRAVLGKKIFSHPSHREKLNAIVWPEILRLASLECEKLHNEGKKVIVYDAAVLLQAGWHENMHQIFVCIIDEEEAVKRIMERDNKSEEEARLRLQSQTPNSELVSQANVVFCTKWSHEYSQKQVDKAWANILMQISK